MSVRTPCVSQGRGRYGTIYMHDLLPKICFKVRNFNENLVFTTRVACTVKDVNTSCQAGVMPIHASPTSCSSISKICVRCGAL